MTCPTGKVMHATREEALQAMKGLVYANYVHGRGERSAGLNVYPCDECSAWHIGHVRIPTVYHYDGINALDAMTDKIALRLPTPFRMGKKFKRASGSRTLATWMALEIREPLIWFSWNAAWDSSAPPHPGVSIERQALIRVGVSACVAKLRWSDYLARNPGRLARLAARCGNPAEWLATDRPVPWDRVRSLEIWHRGAWTAVESVPSEEIDSYGTA